MCYPVSCSTCGKTTWSGCGMHVDQVMKSVPKDKQCEGHQSQGSSLFGSLFGAK